MWNKGACTLKNSSHDNCLSQRYPGRGSDGCMAHRPPPLPPHTHAPQLQDRHGRYPCTTTQPYHDIHQFRLCETCITTYALLTLIACKSEGERFRSLSLGGGHKCLHGIRSMRSESQVSVSQEEMRVCGAALAGMYTWRVDPVAFSSA